MNEEDVADLVKIADTAIPAVDARRYALAHMSGKRIVEMVKENLTMSKVISKNSYHVSFGIDQIIIHCVCQRLVF